MNVLFLMFVFPDVNSSFNMYTALAGEFHKRGHNVLVVAPALKGEKTLLKHEQDLTVLRVRTLPIKNVAFFVKGISNLLLPFQFRNSLKRHDPGTRYELIVLPTPPITLAGLASSLKRKYGAKVYLVLRDIFPQNAVDLGLFRNDGLIHRYFRNMEKKLYSVADKIGCMSPGNIRYILSKNPEIGESKIHELKNFQIQYNMEPREKKSIREQYDLEGKYVVVFGGNMGKPQQLENVLELAERCAIYPDVLFLLLGEGIMIEKLRKHVDERETSNIRIVSTIPKKDYQDLLSVCNVGLISLHKDFTIPNIPSKTLDYFNVGLPVLASLDNATDYNEVLDEAGAGLWSYAGDHDKLFENFKTLYNDAELRNRMSENGHRYFIKFLTPDIAYDTIIRHIS